MKLYHKTWFIVLFAVTIIGIPIAIVLIILQNKYLKENTFDRNSDYAIKELEKISKLIEDKEHQLEDLSKKVKAYEAKNKLVVDAVNMELMKEKLLNEVRTQEDKIASLKKEYIELNEEVLIQEHGLFIPNIRYEMSDEYKQQLDKIQAEIKLLIKNKQSFNILTPMQLNNSSKKGKLMQERNGKQLVRNFLSETDETIKTLTHANYESKLKKVTVSFNQLNKLNKDVSVEISPRMKELIIKKLELVLEYKELLQEEKEIAAEEKRILREQQKLEKELEKKRKELEKEIKHFNKEKTRLLKELESSIDELEIERIKSELSKIDDSLGVLSDENEELENRLNNTRAGYVYVISNIGSFGEDVYKIGVTRRQDPLERVRELSDASVPFKFDVHALIFAEDAFELENQLHKKFRNKNVNAVNKRKEFFNVHLDEIKDVVQNHYFKPVNFTDIPEAIEYRESIVLKNQMNN